MDATRTQVTKFDLRSLSLKLQKDAAQHAKERVSLTLFKDKDRHVHLVAMRPGAVVAEHVTPCPLSIHVLEGKLILSTKEGGLGVKEDELVVFEAGSRYHLRSEGESLFLLTFFPSGSKRVFVGEQDDYLDNWV